MLLSQKFLLFFLVSLDNGRLMDLGLVAAYGAKPGLPGFHHIHGMGDGFIRNSLDLCHLQIIGSGLRHSQNVKQADNFAPPIGRQSKAADGDMIRVAGEAVRSKCKHGLGMKTFDHLNDFATISSGLADERCPS